MQLSWNLVPLDTLGVLRVRGADAGAFLQGQLSNDMTRLSAQRSLLAGYHNAQGRAIALPRLVQLAADDVLAVLPRELVATVAARLGKFVLRAKARLQDESAQWIIEGALASTAPAMEAQASLVPAARDEVRRSGDTLIVRCSQVPARFLLIRAAGTPATLEGLAPLGLLEWQLAAIAAGEPQVYAATSEEFVAQMLNLDLLDAIAFDKGCYTGQEVIARAHYRGRVKRRMQRFLGSASRDLKPGDAATLTDGRAFKVVEAARRPDGNVEFLAVTALTAEPTAARDAAGEPLTATALPLPYQLPL
jgi:tRNA-modifying protein YgfZ